MIAATFLTHETNEVVVVVMITMASATGASPILSLPTGIFEQCGLWRMILVQDPACCSLARLRRGKGG